MTLFLTLWAALGPMSGILIGHMLTRSWQHKQWLLDNRKQEFKAVVSAMSAYIIEHMSFAASQGSALPQSSQAYIDSMKATYITITEQIYIHDDLFETDIPGRFLAIMNSFLDKGKDFGEPADQASSLLAELMTLAQKG